MDCVILAAGKGTRLSPLTDTLPKALVPIAGKPIIEHIFHALPDEIERVCLIVSRDKKGDKLVNYLNDRYPGAPITFIRQTEPKGTGHAFLLAGSFIKSDKFLVLNGDDLYNKGELTELIKYNRAMAVHSTTPRDNRYFSIETDPDGTITGYKYLANNEQAMVGAGAYILDRNIFRVSPVLTIGGKEYGLPHAVLQLAQSHTVKTHNFRHWFQINDAEDLAAAENSLKN